MDVKIIDVGGSRITDNMFAYAYRSVIPHLSTAQFVSIRIHPNRMKELSVMTGNLSDVIGIGTFSEKKGSVVRVIAVPVEVHPKDGAEMVIDEKADPSAVVFAINSVPVLKIANLQLTTAEEKAIADAKAKAEAAAQAAKDEADKKAAFEQGRKDALVEEAKKAGAASVASTKTPSAT